MTKTVSLHMLQKEFVPHQESSELKELGFNEPCLKFYANGKLILALDSENGNTNTELNFYTPSYVSAPTFSQAFRWFRVKHNLHSNVKCINTTYNNHFRFEIESNGETLYCRNLFDTHEEAELACLRKLIEIIKWKE